MPDIDPYKDGTHVGRSVPEVPVLSSTPVIVDPPVQRVSHFGPVTPVAAPRRFNPYPYAAGLLLMVLGMWGLFNWARGDDDHKKERAFIEQHVTVKKPPSDAGEVAVATRSPGQRKSQDTITFDMVRNSPQPAKPRTAALEHQEDAPDLVAEVYDDEIASVDLATEAAPEAPSEAARPVENEPDRPLYRDRPVEAERPVGAQRPAQPEPTERSAPPRASLEPEASLGTERPAAVPIPDFDYSDREMGVMSEGHLTSALTQLDADIDVSEELAQQVGQTGGLEVLEERIDTLKDRFYTSSSPMSDHERLQLTRQVTELRAELSAYQGELYARVAAPQ